MNTQFYLMRTKKYRKDKIHPSITTPIKSFEKYKFIKSLFVCNRKIFCQDTTHHLHHIDRETNFIFNQIKSIFCFQWLFYSFRFLQNSKIIFEENFKHLVHPMIKTKIVNYFTVCLLACHVASCSKKCKYQFGKTYWIFSVL